MFAKSNTYLDDVAKSNKAIAEFGFRKYAAILVAGSLAIVTALCVLEGHSKSPNHPASAPASATMLKTDLRNG